MSPTNATVLRRCQDAVPSWRALTVADVEFDAPKGFSSFTMGVRPARAVDPPALLYRHLDGKQNAILDFETERTTFLLLGDEGIAARCLAYAPTHRIEEFFVGRPLTSDDVLDDGIRAGIAAELFRLHRLDPPNLPDETFFELLHRQWGELARRVLADAARVLPADEQAMCADLAEIHTAETLSKVRHCLPDRPPVFCHNDTYHGNVFLLDDGSVRLLDFEFSCRNHPAFDFANLFAETVMEHGLPGPPHFRIGEPRYTDRDIESLIGHYLDQALDHGELDGADRAAELARLLGETRRAIMLSDYMYAMAALPLALAPIQKIRFIPYAHQRFTKFLHTWHAEFGEPAGF